MLTLRHAQIAAFRKKFGGDELCRSAGSSAKLTRDAETGDVLVEDRLGNLTRLQFDAQGKVGSIRSPLGRVWRLENGPEGLAAVANPAGQRLAMRYGDGGLLSSMARDGDAFRSFSYDKAGRLAQIEFPDKTHTSFGYSANEKISAVTDRLGVTSAFDYDSHGHLISITDGKHNRTSLFYAEGELPEGTRHADGFTEYYAYDPNGRVSEIRWGAEARAEIAYGAPGRPSRIRYSDGEVLQFRYNEDGKLIEAISNGSRASYQYDADGRLIEEEAGGQKVGYEYNAENALTAIRYPSGDRVEFGYDADLRLVSVKDWNGGVHTFELSADDRQTKVTGANGLTSVMRQNSAGMLESLEVLTGESEMFSLRYQRGGDDRVEILADSQFGERRYEYDAEGQLVASAGESFGYDKAGNRISRSIGDNDERSVYNAVNQLVRQRNEVYRYDGRGNMVARETEEGSWRFAYNARNLLISAEAPDGRVTSFGYDAVGRRIWKRGVAGETRFIWAGEQMIAEVGDAGVEEYAYFPGTFTPFAKRAGGRVYSYHTDQVGTPHRLTDDMGNVAWSASYSPFGECHAAESAVDNRLRFPGQYHDAETGLYYNRFRYYSPAMGRYIQRDPLTYQGGFNFYTYADNDPVNSFDPMGTFSWKTALVIAGAVAVGALVVLAAPAVLAAAGVAAASVAAGTLGGAVAAAGTAIVAGAAAGAVGYGLNEALEHGFHVKCIASEMLRGAGIGALAALPFAAIPLLPFVAGAAVGAAAAGTAGYAAAGGLSGAINYAADIATVPGAQWNWLDFGKSVAIGAATAGLLRYGGGKYAQWKEGRAGAPPGEVEPPAQSPKETPPAEESQGRPVEDESRCTGGEPVDTVTGEVLMSKVDFVLPGAPDLELKRSYSSGLDLTGCFGPRWACTWGQWVEAVDDGAMYYGPDGRWVKFQLPVDLSIEDGRDEWVSNPDVDKFRLRRFEDGYQVRDAQRRVLSFTTDRADRWLLTVIEDANGNWIRFTYAADGALRNVDHSGGYRVAVEGRTFQIERVTLLSGEGEPVELVRYEYDGEGRLTGVINGSGLPFRYQYDDQARITRWDDRLGTWYEYYYDELGRCRRAIGPDGMYNYRFDYDDAARTTLMTNSLGATTTIVYNQRKQVELIRDARGNETRTRWDARSHKLEERDSEGRGITQKFDEDGNLLEVRDALGRVTTIGYNDLGQPARLTDAARQVWTRSYDERGNMIEARGPDGNVWRYERNAAGNVVRIVDPSGAARRYDYDSRGLLMAAWDAKGNHVSLAHDPLGRMAERVDRMGSSTRFQYGDGGKLTEVLFPDGARLHWQYDAEGNMVRRVDADGTAYTYRYGFFDLLAETVKPSGATTRLRYDTEARLRNVENELGQVWRYQFSPTGQVVQEQDFHGRRQEYEYDGSGLAVRVVNGMGEEIRLKRDAAGQVVEKIGGEPTRFEYDALGRVRRAVNGEFEVELERNSYGQVRRERQGTRAVESTYDARGLRVRRNTGASDCEWRWDENGEVAGLRVGGDDLLEFVRDANGREVERRMRGGVLLRHEYDVVDRVTRQWAAAEPEAPPMVERQFSYTVNSDPAEIRDNVWGVSRFSYDADGRIASSERERGATEEFRYDPAGNIESATIRMDLQTRFYGKDGRLERIGDTRYVWDADGRMIEKRDGPNRWRYEWNPEGLLRSVQTPDGKRWRYDYDAFARRIRKSGPGGTVHYLWDESSLAEEIRDGSTPEAWMFEPGTYEPLVKQSGGKLYQCINDQIGTPRELIGPDGKIAWSAQFDTWGSVDEVREASTDCRIRFPGQWEDEESGLSYNLFRYYEPGAAQYLTADPLGVVGGLRTYGYVHNPLSWIDPWGLDASTSTHITYVGVKGGKPYVGYASMPGNKTGVEVLNYRYSSNFSDFTSDVAPTVVYRGYGLEAKQTARGLEQRVFEDYGGLAKTANEQNPVGERNPKRGTYLEKADNYRKSNPSDGGVNPKKMGKCG